MSAGLFLKQISIIDLVQRKMRPTFSGAGISPHQQNISYMMKANPISGGGKTKSFDMEFSDRLEY